MLKPAIRLSILGLVMTLGAMVRLRAYVHGRYYTAPAVWQREPVSCGVSFFGLACIGVGAWLWYSESDLDEDEHT